MSQAVQTTANNATPVQQAIFEAIASCAKQETSLAKLGEKVGALKTDAYNLTLEYCKQAIQAAEAVDNAQQLAIVEDCMSDLCQVRKNSTGNKSKKEDATLNRLVTYKSLILKALRDSGRIEGFTAEEKAATKEKEKAEKASTEQMEKIAREANTIPLTVSLAMAMIFDAVRAGTLTHAEWATARHLAETIGHYHEQFSGQPQRQNRNMGDVEIVQPALTH